MISVEELIALRKTNIDSDLSKIDRIVKLADANGNRHCQFSLEPNSDTVELIYILTNLGYTVTHQWGSDQRDGAWSYLIISWV